MNCSKVEKIRGEDLDAAEPDMRRHLENCQRCRSLYEELVAIEELATTLNGGRGAPRGFSEHVFREIESGGWNWKPTATAVSCLAAAALAVVWTSAPQSPELDTPRKPEVVEVLAKPILRPVPDEGPVVRELGDPDYVERIFQHPSGSDYILRLPSTIQIRKDDLPPDAYVSHVSH